MSVNEQRHRAKLRAIAEGHGWELWGVSVVFWPRTAQRLTTLRQAWAEIEADARAARLTGELAVLNYGQGERPRAYWEWSRPDLAYLRSASREDRVRGLHLAGQLTPAELVEFGLEARS